MTEMTRAVVRKHGTTRLGFVDDNAKIIFRFAFDLENDGGKLVANVYKITPGKVNTTELAFKTPIIDGWVVSSINAAIESWARFEGYSKD